MLQTLCSGAHCTKMFVTPPPTDTHIRNQRQITSTFCRLRPSMPLGGPGGRRRPHLYLG